jgi:hypothetical protein
VSAGAVDTICPTCRAGFRGQTLCPRCGTDLEPLMRVVAAAYRLRAAARVQLQHGNAAVAGCLAERAVRLHATEHGRSLLAQTRAQFPRAPLLAREDASEEWQLP